MRTKHPRINREGNTVAAMIALYCRKHHSCDGLCPECAALLDYARKCLDKCPFQEGKTTCAKCPVHCYQPAMRERIRAVMRYWSPYDVQAPLFSNITLTRWAKERTSSPP